MSASNLDQIRIGSMVWSDKHRDGATGMSTRGGIVVDVGIYEDTGKPYVVHLQELTPQEVRVHVYWRGAKQAKSVNVARIERLELAEVDPETIDAPSVTRMEGWAKKAILGAALLPWGKDSHFALIGAAGALLSAAGEITAELRAKTQARVDDFNAELEERRAARRQAS